MNIRLSLICSFLLFLSQGMYAQKTIKVKEIKGSAIISGDVSPNMARSRALNDAKTNALKAAGIGEHINAYEMLFTSHTKKDYSQFFNSDIQSEIQGAVKTYSVLSEKTFCKNEFEIVCEVVISAEVVKYETRPDISFSANIEGIKGVYNNNENLTFEVKATQECYLTIFNITDEESELLLPNNYEKNNKLNKLEKVKFPRANIDYSLGSESKKQETNRLIFVFTKTDIPFIKSDKNGISNSEHIFTWIYSIPPDQRIVEYFALTILK